MTLNKVFYSHKISIKFINRKGRNMDFKPDIKTILKIFKAITKGSEVSLSSFAREAIISAPVFIQDSIQGDEIIPSLSGNLMNYYGSFILLAFNLDQNISDSYTIRDMITRVSSSRESFSNSYYNTKDISKLFSTHNPKLVLESSSDKELTTPVGIKSMFTTGRILNIDFNIGEKQSKKITIKLFINFLNRVLSTSFMNNMFELAYKDKKYRFLKYKAGEISFWKDFVFGLDYVRKQEKLLSQVPPDELETIKNNI